MKVLIYGAGHFGQALYAVFSHAGHDCLMHIRSAQQADAAQHRFGLLTVTVDPPNVDDFNHVFVTTPAAAVPEVLEQVSGKHHQTNLWFVQKGHLDSEVFRAGTAWEGVYYFTGSAISENLAAGHKVGMVLSSWLIRKDALELIHSVESFRAYRWDNPCDLLALNRLRTIVSIQRGIADVVLADQPSTWSLVVSSIESEAKDIAQKIGGGALARNKEAAAVKVMRIVEADQELCSSWQSRNNLFGNNFAKGMTVEEARREIEQERGVVEGIENVHGVFEQLHRHGINTERDFPYLHYTKQLLDGTMTVVQVYEKLDTRREGWI